MQRKGSNGIEKIGDYVGMMVDFDANYENVVKKAADVLKLEAKQCSLVHANGTRIVDEEIINNNKRQPWSIGKYLQFVFTRATGVKLGIFHEDECIEVKIHTGSLHSHRLHHNRVICIRILTSLFC